MRPFVCFIIMALKNRSFALHIQGHFVTYFESLFGARKLNSFIKLDIKKKLELIAIQFTLFLGFIT